MLTEHTHLPKHCVCHTLSPMNLIKNLKSKHLCTFPVTMSLRDASHSYPTPLKPQHDHILRSRSGKPHVEYNHVESTVFPSCLECKPDRPVVGSLTACSSIATQTHIEDVTITISPLYWVWTGVPLEYHMEHNT